MSSFRVTFHRKETLLNSYPEKILFLFVTKHPCEPPSVSVDSAVQRFYTAVLMLFKFDEINIKSQM